MSKLKRILRQTSNKFLNILGAQRSSHQLVLNAPSKRGPIFQHPIGSPTDNQKQQATRKRSSQQAGNSRSKKSNENSIPEALLLAAKNHLPPVQFHHIHGPNALLSKNKFVARRTQSFCQALVFSNRVILPNERVYIKVLEIAKGWSGTIRFGFTSVDPATLRYQMPKHACPDMTSAGHTWARALADEVVRRNSVIHFSYNNNGYIHYGINNQDCGIFYANVNTSQHLWFIVDIYGLTAAVELIDPRIHNASSELDLSRLGDDDDEIVDNGSTLRMLHERGTMFKSTSAMDQLFYEASARASNKKRKSAARKAAAVIARHPASLYDQFAADGFILPGRQIDPRAYHTSMQQAQAARAMLPNLNSIILPPSQQNIYSPMPNRSSQQAAMSPSSLNNRPPIINDSHDYYQIMTSHINPSANEQASQSDQPSRIPTASATNSSALINQSQQTSPSRATDLRTIMHQLNGFQISARSSGDHQTMNNGGSSSAAAAASLLGTVKATNSNEKPVAATRKRQQHSRMTDAQQANKSSHLMSPTTPSASVSKAKSQIKPRARQSLSKRQVAASNNRDNNNSSPISKDCPICFERPINCVLYQCGHMCTCYECGVKQWRTQSRTCPICRTVIKDVIKTYLS